MHRFLIDCLVMAVALTMIFSCAEYAGNEKDPECYTLADCNPGKDCGKMIKCIDGQCDSAQTETLPCQQACASDSDCILADKGCCCGFEPEDYVAIHEDMLSEWLGREACRDVNCPAIACLVPDSIEAVCENDECVVGTKNNDWYACEEDSDCVKVAANCCGCQHAGGEKAINQNFADAYLSELNELCAMVDIACESYDTCTSWDAVCHQGLCSTLREKCDCGTVWDPVCGSTGGMMYTFGSECEADCVDMPWSYHGRCDCMVDCYMGMPVCADNGQTYWCDDWEAWCNGQTVHYPGECREACETCDLLGRPFLPVCGEDFRNYPDMCYAECQDLEWRHDGDCLPGEGMWCGGIQGQACESEDLFCLVPHGCMDCTGECIMLGSCMEPEDCIGQPLSVDDCDGHWTCADHACAWICN